MDGGLVIPIANFMEVADMGNANSEGQKSIMIMCYIMIIVVVIGLISFKIMKKKSKEDKQEKLELIEMNENVENNHSKNQIKNWLNDNLLIVTKNYIFH